LKNKKEIWKADASIGRIRNLAKELITKSEDEKKAFVERLQKKGFKIETLADALGLNKEDWLKRRLQTVLFTKGLVNTPKQSRQLVTHKHVSVGERVVNIPSYMVSLEEEPLVKLNIALKLPKERKPAKKIEKEIEVGGKKVESQEKIEVAEKVEVPEKVEIVEKPMEVSV